MCVCVYVCVCVFSGDTRGGEAGCPEGEREADYQLPATHTAGEGAAGEQEKGEGRGEGTEPVVKCLPPTCTCN